MASARALVVAAAALLAAVGAGGCGGGSTATVTQVETETVTVTTTAATTTTGTTGTTATTTRPTGPTSYEEAREQVLAGTPRTVRRFRSPSGNFYCDLRVVPGFAACELTRTTLTPNPGDTCAPEADDGVGRLAIENGEVSAQCITDTIRTTLRPAVLPYGLVARAPGSPVQCLAREIGITCVDLDGEVAFFVNTSGYRLLEG